MHISVVIPVYNEQTHIGRCLRSLTKQTVKPHEIIVVDNNCTDQTIEIAKRFPVKIIHEKQQGITYARGTGFDEATGPIIARCDADTIVPRDWVERISANFEKKGIYALSGPVYFYDSFFLKRTSLPSKIYAAFMKFIQQHETLLGPNMAITKDVWKKVRNEVCLNNATVHEDIDLAIHIKKYGKIAFDPKLKVKTSSRRILKNPISFFVEYPLRVVKTLKNH
ncbi:MAG TPA: glycosyltransferase family 2 protein [Patescibacteria group bacterium]|nr:glycosyltransferase family 2 protein [Patescibacteria group bacterium]